MNDKVPEEVQEEVEDIAERTRVVPVTMIIAVVVVLVLLATFAIFVDRDIEEGDLDDPQGVINEDTQNLLEDAPTLE
jgi:hypothetical protein